jgi:protease-4
VHCHADGLGNASFMTAALGCDRIALSAGGGVDTVGLSGQLVFFRQLLQDELRVSVDMLQVGRFKGAAEPFTRDTPSDESRTELEELLGAFRTQWKASIAEGRKGASVDGAVEDGPHAAPRAVALGLCDAVEAADVTRKGAMEAARAPAESVRFGPRDSDGATGLSTLVRWLAGESEVVAPLVIVRMAGAIGMGGGGLGSGGISARGYSKLLGRLAEDDRVKGVLLRIDSPGGSALASDLLWQDIQRIRKAKPVVASLGDMAASGGYYLASAANWVVAAPTSLVGSIGVVGGKLAFGRAVERFGVHVTTVVPPGVDGGARARAAYQSALTPWDDGTRARVLETMTSTYRLFIERVAEGRGIAVERVEASAEGRVFDGATAKDRGLVDELGGLADALDKLRALSKVSPTARVAAVPAGDGLLDALSGSDEDEVRLPDMLSSYAPLVSGELAVAAMAHVLRIR